MNIEETIRDIKKEFRASMNGILSAKMREVGMPYKLCFGVELPRLQSIAQEFEPNHQLAQQLWNENIRECFANNGVKMSYDHLNVHMIND